MLSAELLLEPSCLDEDAEEELGLAGRDPRGEELPMMKGSRPKNDHLFDVFVGLESDGLLGEDPSSESKCGVEFLLMTLVVIVGAASIFSDRSRIAPAVLGLELAVLGDGVCAGAEASPSMLVDICAETIEEILPETECPGFAVMVLEVSLETSETGLGMYSILSENPTLTLEGGLESDEVPDSLRS